MMRAIERGIGQLVVFFAWAGISVYLSACGASTAAEGPRALADYVAAGPHAVDTQIDVGPDDRFTVFAPRQLARRAHHIVMWGSSYGTDPLVFSPTLSHLASHGFIVVASAAARAPSANALLDGRNWLTGENRRPASPWYDALASDEVGAAGYSLGAVSAMFAAASDVVAATAALMPRATSPVTVDVRAPLLLVSGGRDERAAVADVERVLYDVASPPTLWAVIDDADHFEPLRGNDALLGYLTAWLRAQLEEDTTARALFYGDDCGICSQPGWTTRRKNLR